MLGLADPGVLRHEALPTESYGRVWREGYVLDKFASKSARLTSDHRIWIERIADSIERSFEAGAPLIFISVTGHAAYWSPEPNPTVSYETWALRRAQAVTAALEAELERRGLLNQVDIAPVDSNSTQQGRARNRRAEVRLREIDPHHRPWRWICALDIDFGEMVHSPYDLKLTGRGATGTGVLVSDRHLLTSAHNVRALLRSKVGNILTWTHPTRIAVAPAQRGDAHTVQHPFGTWRALPRKVVVYPGFDDPVGFGDYGWRDDVAGATLARRLWRNDLAIIELQPRRGKRLGDLKLPGGERFGWWGASAPYWTGFGTDSGKMKRLLRFRDEVRACGYTDLKDEAEPHPKFTRGTAWRHDALLVSRDIVLESGQSGGPWWMTFNGARRLVGIHRGDMDYQPSSSAAFKVESAVLMSPAKVHWLERVTS